MGGAVEAGRRGNPTGWGWALLLGGATVSAVVPLVEIVAYRLLCANVVDWGENRASFCAGPLGAVFHGAGNTATVAFSLAAALGGLALGLSTLADARRNRDRPGTPTTTLLACATVYAVALACEIGRMAVTGGSLLPAMVFAPVTAGVMLAAWLAATGIALVIISVVREDRAAATEPR